MNSLLDYIRETSGQGWRDVFYDDLFTPSFFDVENLLTDHEISLLNQTEVPEIANYLTCTQLLSKLYSVFLSDTDTEKLWRYIDNALGENTINDLIWADEWISKLFPEWLYQYPVIVPFIQYSLPNTLFKITDIDVTKEEIMRLNGILAREREQLKSTQQITCGLYDFVTGIPFDVDPEVYILSCLFSTEAADVVYPISGHNKNVRSVLFHLFYSLPSFELLPSYNEKNGTFELPKNIDLNTIYSRVLDSNVEFWEYYDNDDINYLEALPSPSSVSNNTVLLPLTRLLNYLNDNYFITSNNDRKITIYLRDLLYLKMMFVMNLDDRDDDDSSLYLMETYSRWFFDTLRDSIRWSNSLNDLNSTCIVKMINILRKNGCESPRDYPYSSDGFGTCYNSPTNDLKLFDYCNKPLSAYSLIRIINEVYVPLSVDKEKELMLNTDICVKELKEVTDMFPYLAYNKIIFEYNEVEDKLRIRLQQSDTIDRLTVKKWNKFNRLMERILNVVQFDGKYNTFRDTVCSLGLEPTAVVYLMHYYYNFENLYKCIIAATLYEFQTDVNLHASSMYHFISVLGPDTIKGINDSLNRYNINDVLGSVMGPEQPQQSNNLDNLILIFPLYADLNIKKYKKLAKIKKFYSPIADYNMKFQYENDESNKLCDRNSEANISLLDSVFNEVKNIMVSNAQTTQQNRLENKVRVMGIINEYRFSEMSIIEKYRRLALCSSPVSRLNNLVLELLYINSIDGMVLLKDIMSRNVNYISNVFFEDLFDKRPTNIAKDKTSYKTYNKLDYNNTATYRHRNVYDIYNLVNTLNNNSDKNLCSNISYLLALYNLTKNRSILGFLRNYSCPLYGLSSLSPTDDGNY